MSEYVVELREPHRDENGDIECIYEQRERVIRCRDCRFYDQTIHSCGRIDVAYKAFVSYVFDDGFCAWAEQKEES